MFGLTLEDVLQLKYESKPHMTRYYSAEKMTHDDFGVPFLNVENELVYDAKTTRGPWATMTHTSFLLFGIGLGTGLGQKYIRNKAGELHKVEG